MFQCILAEFQLQIYIKKIYAYVFLIFFYTHIRKTDVGSCISFSIISYSNFNDITYLIYKNDVN